MQEVDCKSEIGYEFGAGYKEEKKDDAGSFQC